MRRGRGRHAALGGVCPHSRGVTRRWRRSSLYSPAHTSRHMTRPADKSDRRLAVTAPVRQFSAGMAIFILTGPCESGTDGRPRPRSAPPRLLPCCPRKRPPRPPATRPYSLLWHCCRSHTEVAPLRPPQPSPGGGAAERAVHDGPSPAGSWIPLRWVGAVARSTASARSVDGSLLGGPSARPPDGPLTVARLGRPQLAQEPNPRMSAISYKHIANRVQRSPGAGVTAIRRSGSSAAGADRPVGATLAQSSPRAAQCAAPRTPARCPAWRRSARRLLCSSMASAEVRTAHGPSAKRGARQLQR
jgi:hypothetical protein